MDTVAAIDVGATRTRAAVIDEQGVISGRIEKPTPSDSGSPEVLIRFIIDLIEGMSRCAGGIGLSVAGPVDRRQGILKNPPNMPFRDVPLTEALEDEFGIPAYIVNDCHAGVLGEIEYGRGKGRSEVTYITISTGIGGGVVSGGRIFLGRDGNAAEIGHFHVDDTYDLPCGCGHTGHWEGYASGRFLPQFYAAWSRSERRVRHRPESAGEVFSLVRQGDRDALAFLDELVRVNARGVSDVIVAYDPEIVIFDGGVMLANADILLPGIAAAVDSYLQRPEMVMTGCSGLAPLMGAGIIARGYDTRYGSFI